MANIFEKHLLSPVGKRTPTGLALDIRLPWYRSLPLSTVEVAAVRIDGREVAAAHMTLGLNGKTFRLAELGELIDEWWYVLDSAHLDVDVPGLTGDVHQIELQLNLYPPYIPGMTWVTRVQQQLRAA